jgi:hypothetical protein
MKFRSGFVSNSSSSSFIIAQKMSGYCEHCGRSDPDIFSILRDSSCEDNNAFEEWRDNIFMDDLSAEELAKIESFEEKEGFKVFYVEISYHDQSMNDLIQKSKDIEILYDFG